MSLKPITLTTLLLSTTAFAQPPTPMNEADMQKMMSAMQEVQACYKRIDQNEVNALQQQSKQFNDRLQALCASGKRQQAEESAKAYYQELMADNTIQQIKACSEKLPESLRSMGAGPLDYSDLNTEAYDHICD